MEFTSINPYDGTHLAVHTEISDQNLRNVLRKLRPSFLHWRKIPLSQRITLIEQVADLLARDRAKHAQMIVLEMGKPINEALAEIDKCIWVCKYYAAHAPEYLATESVVTDASKSFVRKDPMGAVLGIMPWNFPYWQVFRFAVPTLLAGNTVLLKHAPNVFGCAKLIAAVFLESGFPELAFVNLIAHHDRVQEMIAHPDVAAVSLTGSGRAGRSVAALAGQHLKKSLLELGGSNAFVVLNDAQLPLAVRVALNARMRNAGQSCIAAKRLIIEKGVYDEFVARFAEAAAKLKPGNPLDPTTEIGPLARVDLAEQLERQMASSLNLGATLRLGGQRSGAYFSPTILEEGAPGMPAFDEETFGPLALCVRANSVSHAMQLASQTAYGLGISIFTQDIEKALTIASDVDDGGVFINEMVKSDPRLPFGGTKESGYGRELSREGILEFVNLKPVYVR
jgi:succinate-semialdehyde dehydrogenase / glutarate-semialdehyde dehydrogenase